MARLKVRFENLPPGQLPIYRTTLEPTWCLLQRDYDPYYDPLPEQYNWTRLPWGMAHVILLRVRWLKEPLEALEWVRRHRGQEPPQKVGEDHRLSLLNRWRAAADLAADRLVCDLLKRQSNPYWVKVIHQYADEGLYLGVVKSATEPEGGLSLYPPEAWVATTALLRQHGVKERPTVWERLGRLLA